MSKTAPINIALFASTDVGRVRQGNEDNFLIVDLSTAQTWTADEETAPSPELLAFSQNYYGTVAAVSDGMGGALAGEVASNLAVNTVRDRMLEYQKEEPYKSLHFSERLRLAVEQANYLIHTESIQNPQYAGMGATFTAAGLFNDELYMAQIGDSRAYLIRNGQIQQMTRDQSLVGSLVEAGHITEEEAETHAYRNVILQALGATPSINVDVRRLKGQPRDVVLICSDGLSGKVRAPEMLEIVTKAESLKDACAALIAKANERGGEDNITVVLVQITGDGLVTPDDPNFDYDTIPRNPELTSITKSLEDRDSPTDEIDPLGDTQQIDASEITLTGNEPDERIRAQPAPTTQPLAPMTQLLDSRLATQPLDSSATNEFQSAVTQPMSQNTEPDFQAEIGRTMELLPSVMEGIDNNIQQTVPFSPQPAKKDEIPLKAGIAGTLVMVIFGLILLLAGAFFAVWKFILHR